MYFTDMLPSDTAAVLEVCTDIKIPKQEENEEAMTLAELDEEQAAKILAETT